MSRLHLHHVSSRSWFLIFVCVNYCLAFSEFQVFESAETLDFAKFFFCRRVEHTAASVTRRGEYFLLSCLEVLKQALAHQTELPAHLLLLLPVDCSLLSNMFVNQYPPPPPHPPPPPLPREPDAASCSWQQIIHVLSGQLHLVNANPGFLCWPRPTARVSASAKWTVNIDRKTGTRRPATLSESDWSGGGLERGGGGGRGGMDWRAGTERDGERGPAFSSGNWVCFDAQWQGTHCLPREQEREQTRTHGLFTLPPRGFLKCQSAHSHSWVHAGRVSDCRVNRDPAAGIGRWSELSSGKKKQQPFFNHYQEKYQPTSHLLVDIVWGAGAWKEFDETLKEGLRTLCTLCFFSMR